MKMLHKVVPALLSLSLSSLLCADTEFGDSVPREVVEQFIGDAFGGGPGKLYSDILDAFPPFAVPAGFSVLASADQTYMQRVILKTDADEAAANAAIRAAFIAEGWQELPVFGAGLPQTGFVSEAPRPQPLQLCNDALGRMAVNVSTGGAPRYVSLNFNNIGPTVNGMQQSCAEQIEMMRQGPMGRVRPGGPQLSEYVPRLVMPETEAPDPRMMRGFIGGGGSSNDWETEGSLALDWSADQLLEHFTAQVDMQGWARDAAVTGAAVATASWTKTVDDMNLIGILTIVAEAESRWNLKFRILRAGAASNNAAVIRDRVEIRN